MLRKLIWLTNPQKVTKSESLLVFLIIVDSERLASIFSLTYYYHQSVTKSTLISKDAWLGLKHYLEILKLLCKTVTNFRQMLIVNPSGGCPNIPIKYLLRSPWNLVETSDKSVRSWYQSNFLKICPTVFYLLGSFNANAAALFAEKNLSLWWTPLFMIVRLL